MLSWNFSKIGFLQQSIEKVICQPLDMFDENLDL